MGHRALAAALVATALAGCTSGEGPSPPGAAATSDAVDTVDTGGTADTVDTGGTADTVAPTGSRPATAPHHDTATASATVTTPSACPEDGAVDSVSWTEAEGGVSLAVTPASALRECAGPLLRWESEPPGWGEVVDLAGPDADSAAMRQQYACHLRFARVKDVWRLEPWRPLVDEEQLLVDRCNPSGP